MSIQEGSSADNRAMHLGGWVVAPEDLVDSVGIGEPLPLRSGRHVGVHESIHDRPLFEWVASEFVSQTTQVRLKTRCRMMGD
ncbi:MAG: hypothetical protein ACRDO1_02750 [Nocardioidaceae bacterium]